MSLIKILPEYVEKFSLSLHPEVRYLSSSFEGATAHPTGSMPVAVRPSKCFKNLTDPSQMGENSFDVNSAGVSGFNEGDFSLVSNLKEINKTVKKAYADGTSANVSGSIAKYMELVNSASIIARNTKKLPIVRFDPPFSFTMNSSVKNCIRKVLMPFYSAYYDVCQFSYTNYNTLNFFTGSLVPSASAIMYPNFVIGDNPRPYSPTGSFSLDFYINPRYANDYNAEFKAGTIMHISSTFALSLVSGTLKDGNDTVDGYRLLLQLSHSADIAPSTVDLSIANNKRSYPQDLIFTSNDNSLRKNHWHHVCVRWGGNEVNDGTGSIHIDDKQYYFNIPSSSILPPSHVSANALFIGNYYEAADSVDEAMFFNIDAGQNGGVYPYEAGYTDDPPWGTFKLDHPLNAEVHDLKIFNDYISGNKIKYNESFGQRSMGSEMSSDRLMFYLPPLFTQASKTRDSLITPFQTEKKWTKHPFNTTFSFGVGGYLINLPNFCRDFKEGNYPRLYNLTASTIDTTVLDITANGYVFGTGSIRKGNLTILPNDNGRFIPDYDLLRSGSINTDMSTFKSVHGGLDLSIINVNEMIPTSSAYAGLATVSSKGVAAAVAGSTLTLPDDTSSESIASQVAGVSPDSMGGGSTSTSQVLTIYQRTRDPSSNEITIFDISNLYYGNRISPGSLYITDPDMSGSGGKVKVTLRDNEKGGLYRADALTKHPRWANVGNVLYNEGVAIIKSPHVAYFGKNKFEMSFKGDQNIHILTVSIPAGVGLFNSSSNPQYKVLSASSDASDKDQKFVYVSGFNLHDDNLNIIMRGNLAQPITKREQDEFLIKFKMDF